MPTDLPWFSFLYLGATMAADHVGLYAPIDQLSGVAFAAVMLPVGALWLLGLAWGFERFDSQTER